MATPRVLAKRTTHHRNTDAHGAYIPARLRPVFDGRRAIEMLAEKFEVLLAEVSRLEDEKCGRDLGGEALKRAIRMVRTRILHGMPWLLCEDCRGGDSQCPLCLGDGWTSLHRYRKIKGRLPAESCEASSSNGPSDATPSRPKPTSAKSDSKSGETSLPS